MISRVVAFWLVTLIVLPFTAPFATCEAQASQSGSSVRSLADPATTHALQVARTLARTRIKVAVSTAGTRVGLRLTVAPERIRHAAATLRFISAPLALPLRI